MAQVREKDFKELVEQVAQLKAEVERLKSQQIPQKLENKPTIKKSVTKKEIK